MIDRRPGEAPGSLAFILDTPSFGSEVLRYGLAMAVVILCAVSAVVALERLAAAPEDAAEIDNAVLIELPAAEASSAPPSDAADGPEQRAAQASVAQQTPEQVEPPKETPKPIDPTPVPNPAPVEPPPPVAPDPPAVLEPKKDEVPTPKAVEAAATPAQEERAPSGSPNPVKTDAVEGDEGRPHASRHAITLWQRSLLQRLERSKHQTEARAHAMGTVTVAFTIDGDGRLATEHVAKGSGTPSLDDMALLIVKQAAPFPAPPAKADERDMSFVLPIHFR